MVICYNHGPIWIHHNQGPPRLHQGSFSGIHLMGLTLWKHRVFHCSKNPLCSPYSVLVVQLLSRVQLFETPWTSARQDSLSFTISLSLLKLITRRKIKKINHKHLVGKDLLKKAFKVSFLLHLVLVAAQASLSLWHWGFTAAMRGPCCPEACGILDP